MSGAIAAEAAERLRALPDALGGALHGRRRRAREARCRRLIGGSAAGVRRGQPDQRADRGADLADDLPDDAQDRFREHPRRAASGRRGSSSRCS